ncbi:hypothetical protein TNIN_138191 [Trichonephila inaurata madagascariensis]|uniref:Uncharacterized protein n=1 Tax=Trichonephila inaurata madagascariensis TaxID=2747483 RepID=A0A8X6YC17_9ARAC|nr:hypothetical protein TNIN_138191 [Trichonephila inaurata madagascariensis]
MAVTRFLLTLKPGAVDSRFEVNDFLGKAFQFTAVNFARNSEPKETSPEEKNHARIMNSEQKEDNVSEHSSGVNEKNGWFCHLVFRDKSKKSESEKAEGVNGVTEGESKMVHTVKSQMCVQEIPKHNLSPGDKHQQIIKDITRLWQWAKL